MEARRIIRLFADRANPAAHEAPRRKASDYAAVLVGVAMIALMQNTAVATDEAALLGFTAPVAATEQEIGNGTQPTEALASAVPTAVEPVPQSPVEQQPAVENAPPTAESTPPADPTPAPSAAPTQAPTPEPSPAPTQAPTPEPAREEVRTETSSRSSRPAVSANATPAERFVAEHAEDAISSMRETGVPASVTLAQAILESNSGKSLLSTKAQNYFGIKARGKEGPAGVVYMDTWEVIGGKNVTQREPFRAYNNASESFADHGLYLKANVRYAAAFRHTDDAREFARLIHQAGYATDPNYSSKLIRLMDTYDLYQYDR